MELKLDLSKTYAIALEGGGAKGAYQIGAWRALQEAGVRYNAVAGTSVGALNGAMMAMRDLENAEKLWKDIRFSQIMNVDDETMQRIMNRDFENLGQLRSAARAILEIVRDGGLDVAPLRQLLAKWVDEEKIRQSGIDFYLATFSLTDREPLEVAAKDLPEGELAGMLLASAYFPAFKQEPIGGKNYTDGGFYDVIPITPLIRHGYKDIIAIRINGFGIERRVKIPEDVVVTTISPHADLGNVLNFSREQSAANMVLGYYDTQRVLYGLYGETYYIDRTLPEKEAYDLLLTLLRAPQPSLRQLNEEVIPALAARLHCRGDYYDLLIAVLEHLAALYGLTPFRIRTDREVFEEISSLRQEGLPKADRITEQFLTDSTAST